MDRHYARLVELSQEKGDYTPNKQVFLDAMYVVSLCYIHNVKIKDINMYGYMLKMDFDTKNPFTFFLRNDGYLKEEHLFTHSYLCNKTEFDRTELKNVFLDEFVLILIG